MMSFESPQSAIEEPHRGLGMRWPVMRRRNSEGLECAFQLHRWALNSTHCLLWPRGQQLTNSGLRSSCPAEGNERSFALFWKRKVQD